MQSARLPVECDIPIHSGAEKPLLISQRQTEATQFQAISSFTHRRDFAPNRAVEFLRQTIHHRPGELTLLAIGPLTNIALLFALDPEIPSMLKRLVIMGGVFTTQLAHSPRCEWNIMVDPHAAAIVYHAAIADHLSIGLDVTMQCKMNADDCRKRLHGGALDVVCSDG